MHIDKRINIVLESTEAALKLMEIEKDNLEIVRDLEKIISHNNKVLIALNDFKDYLNTREKI